MKPAGIVQRVEPSPAQDSGKSDAGTWEAVFARANMLTAKIETDGLETLEAGNNALPGIGETWSTPTTSRTWSSCEKSLAYVPNTCDKRSPEQRLLAQQRA